MNTYKLEWTRLQNNIFRLLCIKAGKDMSMRSIAKELNVSPTSVSKSIKKLESENIVNMDRHERINLLSISLNEDNPKVIGLKRAENLRMIYESGLLSYLYGKFPGSTIVLFGSYSRGEDLHDSDIDIAIIGKEKKVELEKFEEYLGREVSLNFYDDMGKINKNLKENIVNGIVLEGGIEL